MTRRRRISPVQTVRRDRHMLGTDPLGAIAADLAKQQLAASEEIADVAHLQHR
ncbi:hypothetical protein [Mycobacterium sp.]|uniref:hypothetical protein n=1 Tax=Mycobacterium sp. TaxID=1785 RepID=UPI003BAAC267